MKKSQYKKITTSTSICYYWDKWYKKKRYAHKSSRRAAKAAIKKIDDI